MNRLSALPILIFVTLVEPLQAIAQETQQQPAPAPPQGYYMHGPWHMWGDGYGWPFWWMFPMMLFMLFAFGVIFFFACRSFFHGAHHWGPPSPMIDRPWSDPSHSALQILNERFARGEIQKDEYGEKKAAILSGGQR
jgi:putative membrane protein